MSWFRSRPRSKSLAAPRSLESLERRDLLSAAPFLDDSGLAAALATQSAEILLVDTSEAREVSAPDAPAGTVVVAMPTVASVPDGVFVLADSPGIDSNAYFSSTGGSADVSTLALNAEASLSGLNIVINAGATLAANTAALNAFNRAAAQWEALFADPITVTISADMVNLGSSTIIGQASSVLVTSSYNTYRNKLVADADSDDAIVASLPTSGQFTATLPPGFNVTGSLSGTKANLKAAGVTGLDGLYGATDATIQFNTLFSFDFDNSNGVTGGTIDFETVAAHEIGHALGFTSIVDTVDAHLEAGTMANVTPHLLDLFRFANNVSGQDPATSSQFTTYPRYLNTGGTPIFDDTASEWRLSTGVDTGDGRQASHWKDNGLTGTLIGVMDPTIAYGQVVAISTADIRALDLIGWDYVNQPPVLGAIGNKSVAEGSLLSFTATASDPNPGNQLTYSLGAGAPAGASIHSTSGLFTWTPTDSYSVPPSVTIIVSDNGTPVMSDSETIQITVQNVAPTAGLSGPASGVRGQPQSYTLTATDPSSVDQAAGFTFAIDWNGDLVTDQTVVGPSGTTVSHVFTNSGNFNVRVTATDKDGGTSAVFTQPMSVADWALVPHGGNPLLTDLVWGGTSAGDSLYFRKNYAGAIEVYDLALGSLIVSPIAGVSGDVVAYLQSGADLLVAAGLGGASFDSGDGDDALAILSASSGAFALTGGIGNDKLFLVDAQNIQLTLDGGDGDDELFMLNGSNIQTTMLAGTGSDAIIIINGSAITALLDGGANDDVILDMSSGATTVTVLGGSGDDLVIGGSGADSLDGGTGNDLIVGGVQGTDGNDTILGGDGNDVLAGHLGADVLQGGAGEDLLLTGSFAPAYFGDEPVPGIVQVWNQWRSADSLATRKAYLTGTPGGIIDLAFAMVAGSTVLDDGAVDTVSGETSGDWFLYDFSQDLALDYSAATDVRTDLG